MEEMPKKQTGRKAKAQSFLSSPFGGGASFCGQHCQFQAAGCGGFVVNCKLR